MRSATPAAFVLSALVITSLLTSSSVAFAQTGNVVNKDALDDKTAAINMNPNARTHFDIFVGNGKPGPYVLSWNNLRVYPGEPMSVVVDGKTLAADAYTVDVKKGTITFKTPLAASSVVRVSYFYDAKSSKRNDDVATTPITVPLLRFGGANVKMTALPTPDNAEGKINVPVAFESNGRASFAGGNLTTRFNLAGTDNLGMQLGYKVGNDKNGLDASFYRADKELVKRFGETLGYTDASQQLAVNTRLQMMGGKLTSRFNYAGSEKVGMQFGYAVGNAKTGLDAAYYSADKDMVAQFGQKLGYTDASHRYVLNGRMNLAGGGLTTKYEDAGYGRIALQSAYAQGNAQNGVNATYYMADKKLVEQLGKILGYGEMSRKYTLAIARTPNKWIGLNFTSNDLTDLNTRNQRGQNTLNVRIGTAGGPRPTLGFTRVEDMSLDPAKKETSVTTDKLDIGVKMTTSTSVALTGVQTIADVPVANGDAKGNEGTVTITSVSKDNQTQASVSFNGGNKEMVTSLEEKNSITVRLQAAPVFIVSAEKRDFTVTPRNTNGSDGKPTITTSQSLGLDMIPMPGSKLTGVVAETEVNEVKVSSTTWNAQVGTGKSMEFATGVTNRFSEVVGTDPLDTTRASVILRPSKQVTVTSSYTWNPETQGVVSQAHRQEIGLTAKLGTFEMGSGYAITTLNGLANVDNVDPQFAQLTLNLGWIFGRNTKLNGTYQDSLRYRAARTLPANLVPLYVRMINFAFTHTPGPGFNLTLGTIVTDNRADTKIPYETKFEGKMGVKF